MRVLILFFNQLTNLLMTLSAVGVFSHTELYSNVEVCDLCARCREKKTVAAEQTENTPEPHTHK